MIAALNPTSGAPVALSLADPVLVLIEEHRAAYAAWAAEVADRPALAAAACSSARYVGDQERAALAALVVAQPTTLAGVLALAEYLPGAIRQVAIDDESEGERALRSIAAALRDLVPPAAAPAPDPVLVAIAASRKAQAEMEAFLAETRGQSAMTPSDRARESALSVAQIGTDTAVWRAVPTTQAGRRALVEYAQFQARVRTAPDGYIDDAEGLLEVVLTALTASIAAEPALPVQDAGKAQVALEGKS